MPGYADTRAGQCGREGHYGSESVGPKGAGSRTRPAGTRRGDDANGAERHVSTSSRCPSSSELNKATYVDVGGP